MNIFLVIFFSCFAVIVGLGMYAILREFGFWKWLENRNKVIPIRIEPPKIRAGLLQEKPAVIKETKSKLMVSFSPEVMSIEPRVEKSSVEEPRILREAKEKLGVQFKSI
jgi:hypothetical protein